jgi:phage-related minor tail protein
LTLLTRNSSNSRTDEPNLSKIVFFDYIRLPGLLGERLFHSFTSNMNSAIDTFVENGTFSFSQFAESVIKDILKIEMRMQASQLLSMGIKFAMGAIGGAMAGGQDVSGISTAQWQSGAFADGGNPPVGVPSLVGERGPELFVPSRAGTIIPNNQLGSILGGGSGVTYNGPYIASMQAIDTQSGIQFLAKNKMTIWSMNQSANRSIPAGR